jgi:glutathione S-transferase
MTWTLFIGNKNYSSWSLRAWLVLKLTGVNFIENLIFLRQEQSKTQISKISGSKKVPALKVSDQLTVYDSLAISEFLAEQFPQTNLWPKETNERAIARSICAEIHSGFPNLRKECPMDIKNFFRSFNISQDAKLDCDRVFEIWRLCLQTRQEGFLFGEFGITDCFFAPIITRFKTYDISIPDDLNSYAERVLAHKFMQEWRDAALKETQQINYFL